MLVIETWTGNTAAALQRALRLTNEAFAEHLGIAVRTVANWHARPEIVPSPDLQQVLDRVHQDASPEVRERFAHFAGFKASQQDQERPAPIASEFDLEILDAIDWLDDRAQLPEGTSEQAVINRLQEAGFQVVRGRGSRRGKIGRTQLAETIQRLYGEPSDDLTYYSITGDEERLTTSMLVRADWLCTGIPLNKSQDHFEIVESPGPISALDPIMHNGAVQRIAEIIASGTRFFNADLYAVRDIDISPDALSGQLSLTDFREYALTTDLVTTELVDALADDPTPSLNALPLRQRYLPSIEAAQNLGTRGPGGGILSLFAAARPARHGRPADYLILVQERSRQVVNANGQLAVIPKAFHQPMVNFTDDAHLSATLTRELEEELFGRDDLELGAQGVADPTHPSRLSEPMRWLNDHQDPSIWQMDCTGFGINLLTGNYEFSAVTAIHDEQWWIQFGGQVMANWEASHVQQFSSRDPVALRRLIRDDRWSNEGLFALLRGLQRLAEIAPDRTAMPKIMEEL